MIGGSMAFSVDNIYDKLTYDYFNYYCLDLDRQHMIFSSLSHLIRFKKYNHFSREICD